MGAIVVGVLKADGDGCLHVVDPSGLQLATPLWPAGFTALPVSTGVEVLDTSGHVIARTGQQIHLTGGFKSVSPSVTPCQHSTADLFEVNQQYAQSQ